MNTFINDDYILKIIFLDYDIFRLLVVTIRNFFF